MEKLSPIVPLDLDETAIPTTFNDKQAIDFGQDVDPVTNAVNWTIKGVPYHSPWEYPSRCSWFRLTRKCNANLNPL
jgi:hypothetical protein